MNINYAYHQLFMDDVNHYIQNGFPNNAFSVLGRGITPINSNESLRLYNAMYGGHHIAKFKMVLPHCSKFINNGKRYSIIDWACGQALASSMLIDYTHSIHKLDQIDHIYLFEPSSLATNKATYLLKLQFDQYGLTPPDIIVKNKFFNETQIVDFKAQTRNPFIHLFSNALDINVGSTTHVMSIIKDLKNPSLIAATYPNYGMTQLAYQKMKNHFHIDNNIEQISNHSGYTQAMIYLLKYKKWSMSNIAYNQNVIKVNNNA